MFMYMYMYMYIYMYMYMYMYMYIYICVGYKARDETFSAKNCAYHTSTFSLYTYLLTYTV